MKKLNEGPRIHKNHKGNHLTNADGEVVQSFGKDREGLKAARQAMYKNYKGLNMKKPQPEQQTTEDEKMSDLENKLKEQLEEGITVNTTSTNDDNVEDSMTVTAQGEDALELMAMLKMAGIGGKTEAPIEVPAEETPCGAMNDIDDMANMIQIIPLDDVEAVEEEAELANAPDEKYADTDTLVNKISGGLNRQKKAYDKAEDGDNPMAVESDESDDKIINNKPLDEYTLEELEAEKDDLEQEVMMDRANIKDMHYKDKMRLEAVYDLIADKKDQEQAEIDTSYDDNTSTARMKAMQDAKNESVHVTESEEELTARLLREYDEFKVTAPEDSDEGNWEIENVGKWAVKIGNTENVEATDGEIDLPFDTDLASALADEAMTEADEEGLVEDEVEEGLRIEYKDGSCEGSRCPDERKKKSKEIKDEAPDALDKEMSEDKK